MYILIFLQTVGDDDLGFLRIFCFSKSPGFRHQEPPEATPQLTGTQKAKELNRALRRLVLGANGVVNAADRSL